MDIFVSISSFLYRIRYKLLYGAILAVVMTIYFTQFLPKIYNVSTTIFTGITSKSTLDNMSGNPDWNTASNAHDNIINLVKSKGTLELVSLNLIAQDLIHGDPKKDNNYISAAHYRKLLEIMSPEVLAMVDKSSHEKTLQNLINYKKEDRNNCLYGALNWSHKHYSYLALSKIKVVRKGNSDMIEISYECNDPGIATNTLTFLTKVLTDNYESLLLSASENVTKHFEEQLVLAREKLTSSEDELVDFNMANNIINYGEQTKYLAAMNNEFESRYEQILLENTSSKVLVDELESQLSMNAKMVRENEAFLRELENVSATNGKIAELEIFGGDDETGSTLSKYKTDLAKSESIVKQITDSIDIYKFSKEGVVVTDVVQQWLSELLKYQKSSAELKVMRKRKDEIEKLYSVFSPVGPNLDRKDREVRVDEESYLTILHHLGLSKLKQKNILLDAGTLQVVSAPEFPLITMPRKRELYVIIAFFASILFIIGFYLILELVDRTIRDGARAERLSAGKVLGAFPANTGAKLRQYAESISRMSISYLANSLNRHIKPGAPTVFNLLSLEPGEGKSFIAKQLQQYWVDKGFSVAYVSYHKEFGQENKSFYMSTSVNDLFTLKQGAEVDIIIAEYQALKENSVPEILLKEASVNLLILDATRAWKPNDAPIFAALRKIIDPDKLFIYLNKADREAVEAYTGQLPPYTFMRNLSYRLFNFGITANKSVGNK